tara:strand:- start:352 stop:993 length:642 start_codon:yes stop_codon:yes gene_type:complete
MSSIKQNSTTIAKVYNSRKILLKQCKNRGYNIEDWSNFSINEVQTMYNNKQLDMLLEHKDSNKKMYIKYNIFTKLRPQNVNDFIEDFYNIENLLDKDDDFIIIIKNKPNTSLANLLKTIYNNEGIYLNIIDMHTCLFNILNHKFVPSHRVLSDEEKEEVIKKYNVVKDSELPEISRFDPVAKVIGLRPNQLCEITRSSSTSITTKYYRLCYNN